MRGKGVSIPDLGVYALKGDGTIIDKVYGIFLRQPIHWGRVDAVYPLIRIPHAEIVVNKAYGCRRLNSLPSILEIFFKKVNNITVSLFVR